MYERANCVVLLLFDVPIVVDSLKGPAKPPCSGKLSLLSIYTSSLHSLSQGVFETYSGLQNCCNVWGFWTGGDVAPGGVGITLSAGEMEYSTSSWLPDGL